MLTIFNQFVESIYIVQVSNKNVAELLNNIANTSICNQVYFFASYFAIFPHQDLKFIHARICVFQCDIEISSGRINTESLKPNKSKIVFNALLKLFHPTLCHHTKAFKDKVLNLKALQLIVFTDTRYKYQYPLLKTIERSTIMRKCKIT